MEKLLPFCDSTHCPSGCQSQPTRRGFFKRFCDEVRVQRYRCPQCKKTFSSATHQYDYRHRKRKENLILLKLFTSGVSQRRSAFITKLNRKSVVRKFIQISLYAHKLIKLDLQKQALCEIVEFDDLETFEHTKCKPLSTTLMGQHKRPRVLGFEVSVMPANGKLAKISREKYGIRKDERAKAREDLFKKVKPYLAEGALIKSDMNPHYAKVVRDHFPKSEHKAYKGARGCITGQGELKKLANDPLFSLNHTCAMMRANMNRLFRRTWCTTKKKERLDLHLALYSYVHNCFLIYNKAR